MKERQIVEMMSLLALVSALILVMMVMATSPRSPWPLTVSRLASSSTDQTNVKEDVITSDPQKQESSPQTQQEQPQKIEAFQSEFPMDINQAEKEALMEVEGIGEKKAQSILDYRAQVGKIETMDQLLEVEGIGEVTLERLCEKFYVA